MRKPSKPHVIAETQSDGSIKLTPLRAWVRAHPGRSRCDLDDPNTNTHKIRDDFRRQGWDVADLGNQVRITPPESADRVAEVLGLTDNDETTVEDEDTKGAWFAFERELQAFVAGNLDTIDVGGKRLKLYSDERGSGIEYPTGVGPIDILACDESDGALVVFELKRATSPDRAVGQIARYMGWVRIHLANGRPVRGVIVARQTSEYLRYAMVAVPDVSVYEYSVKFALTPARAPGAE
ncbi:MULTISPECIES: endonuclease NucS domain-containing protein [unclassified Burkholderia]|uniref:endonuclease NucS domain-containing protein n=1 Tax=unclassified Burkholderia TaxID=2613784 RepID=UPI002ABDCB89|nr:MULTISPECIES: endonuclease NucS domain-containing protein [unclassified Burkholderia]